MPLNTINIFCIKLILSEGQNGVPGGKLTPADLQTETQSKVFSRDTLGVEKTLSLCTAVFLQHLNPPKTQFRIT